MRHLAWIITATLALALSACGGDTTDGDETYSDALRITDPWVKAAEDGMTAGFAEVQNSGKEDVTVVAVTSDAAEDLELHETVDDGSGQMSMQEKKGGFVIPAGGSLVLEPGGNHIMFMSLTGPIEAGQEVELTLELSDGSTCSFTAPAKDYSGANESYHDDHGDHGDHEETP